MLVEFSDPQGFHSVLDLILDLHVDSLLYALRNPLREQLINLLPVDHFLMRSGDDLRKSTQAMFEISILQEVRDKYVSAVS